MKTNPVEIVKQNGKDKILSNLDVLNTTLSTNLDKAEIGLSGTAANKEAFALLCEPVKNIGRLWKEYGLKMKPINDKYAKKEVNL